ncbi:MAG: DUF4430 domain-containing protein [Lachnospiraceae bacterium]|nr:DUF4430 domain-containing protein [Lachnospiraceae bacterium]
MMRRMKRGGAVFLLIFCLAAGLTGCSVTTLDEDTVQNESVVETDSAAETEESSSQAVESSAEETTESASRAVLSVDDVTEDAEENLDKYAEETVTETVAASGAGSDLVTYSDGEEEETDEYKTDPIPEGQPNPVEPEDVEVDESVTGTATLLIECSTLLDNMDALPAGKEKSVPEDGIIYAEQTVTFYEGESVFDVLLRETRNNRIQMEYSFMAIYNSNYIEGIHNLYEFDGGELSGWMYCVNGWYPNYGCSRYIVKEGDVIEWHYTCDLGRDLGADMDW